jgi:hypothetical protein
VRGSSHLSQGVLYSTHFLASCRQVDLHEAHFPTHFWLCSAPSQAAVSHALEGIVLPHSSFVNSRTAKHLPHRRTTSFLLATALTTRRATTYSLHPWRILAIRRWCWAPTWRIRLRPGEVEVRPYVGSVEPVRFTVFRSLAPQPLVNGRLFVPGKFSGYIAQRAAPRRTHQPRDVERSCGHENTRAHQKLCLCIHDLTPSLVISALLAGA